MQRNRSAKVTVTEVAGNTITFSCDGEDYKLEIAALDYRRTQFEQNHLYKKDTSGKYLYSESYNVENYVGQDIESGTIQNRKGSTELQPVSEIDCIGSIKVGDELVLDEWGPDESELALMQIQQQSKYEDAMHDNDVEKVIRIYTPK